MKHQIKLICITGFFLLFFTCAQKEGIEQTFKEAEQLEAKIINSLNTIATCKQNYEKVLMTDPESEFAMIACFKLGKLNELFGHYPEAIDYYQKLLTLFPESSFGAEALLNSAQIYQLHLEQPENAVETYNQLLRFYPQSELRLTALLRLGQYWSRKKDWKKAVTSFQQIITEFPREKVTDEVCFRVADILKHELNDSLQSQKFYQQLVDQYPQSPWLKEAQKRLSL